MTRPKQTRPQTATITPPWQYIDDVTGNKISVTVSPFYSKLTINEREYYFIRDTGEFDGTATTEHIGPILIYDRGRAVE